MLFIQQIRDVFPQIFQRVQKQNIHLARHENWAAEIKNKTSLFLKGYLEKYTIYTR